MRRRGTALLTLSFMLIYTAVTILIPLVLRESINRYVLNGDTQGLNTAVAIFFALVLVNYILGNISFDENQIIISDINQDGSLDVMDIVILVGSILD